MNRTELVSLLDGAGDDPVVLGGRIVVLPDAGRVVGLFPTDEENALWVNEAAFDEVGLQSWPNHGGDRVWISPEQDTMLAAQPDGSFGITIPPELDPAGYAVISRDDLSCELRASAAVRFRRACETVELEWSRRIEALSDAPHLHGRLSAAGYRVTTTLRAAEPPLPDEVQPAIWSILQVPPGARIAVPTHRAARRIHAFIGTPVVDADEEGVLTCEVRADASFKFGLQIGDSRGVSLAELGRAGEAIVGVATGEAGAGEPLTLVVREFDRFPATTYSDVPADDPGATGFVHQIYVDDGGLGGFGELEHHSPYLREEDGYRVTDVSYTYAYRGKADGIARVRAALRT